MIEFNDQLSQIIGIYH